MHTLTDLCESVFNQNPLKGVFTPEDSTFLYILQILVKYNNGDIMRKLIILCIILLIFFNYKEKTYMVFSYTENNIYDIHKLKFENCNLSTNNFISIFDYFKDKDFKILEIVPYISYNSKFRFYSDDIKYILNKFKSEYLDLIISDSKYVKNICIKEVVIITSNYELIDFKNIIDFVY